MRKFSLNLPRRTHIAITRKSWGLTRKILTGEKTIESRWYQNKSRPWNQIDVGDIVYFKDSGEPVTIRAEVSKVLQFENLNPGKVREILCKYGRQDGLGAESGAELKKCFELFKGKKYCLLVFLGDVEVVVPFEIDKAGFGARAAWLVVDDIQKIRKRS